jgi:hypothetical protein
MKCLFCKRTMKDDVFHVCPPRVPSMGRMGIPRNKRAAQPLRAVDAAMPPSAEADSSLVIVSAVEFDTQPRT